MHYLLAKNSDLTEILPLRCDYMRGLGLQLAIHGIGLQPLNGSESVYLNYPAVSSPDIETLIARFVEDIDYASLQLILSHPNLKNLINADNLLSRYHIPSSKHVYTTLERSAEWSEAVLSWLAQKKVKPQEISFLNLLSNDDARTLLSKVASSSLSKTDSLKLLETISELMLMKRDLGSMLESEWNDLLISSVHAMRYPISFQKNPIRQVDLRWPKSVSTTPKRILDKMGFQVQFFVSDPKELNLTLVQLEKMIPDWASQLQETP